MRNPVHNLAVEISSLLNTTYEIDRKLFFFSSLIEQGTFILKIIHCIIQMHFGVVCLKWELFPLLAKLHYLPTRRNSFLWGAHLKLFFNAKVTLKKK